MQAPGGSDTGNRTAANMTANDPTRPRSDNSIPLREYEGGVGRLAPERDARLQTVVQFLADRDGAVARDELAARAGWTLDETDEHLRRLRQVNCIQLLDEFVEPVVLLTERGERLANGGLDADGR